MKKIIIGVIVVLVVLVGGYAAFHKSAKKTPVASSTSTTNSSSPSQGSTVDNAVLTTKTSAGIGQYLADPNGNALYTYGGDSANVSNCSGSCLASWPAYQDTGSTTYLPANISTITRTDNGTTQYTYKGLPLYTFAADSQGKVTGNGVGNFSVAKP